MLGKKVRCTITGFTGIAISKIEYINGCVQYSIQPKKLQKDGSPVKSVWFDVGQLEIVDEEKASVEWKDTGGPTPSSVPHFGR